MIFEDRYGNLLRDEDINSLDMWEIEERGLHVYDKSDSFLNAAVNENLPKSEGEI